MCGMEYGYGKRLRNVRYFPLLAYQNFRTWGYFPTQVYLS